MRTCSLEVDGSLADSFLKPKAVAACAKLEEDRVTPSCLGLLTVRLAGFAGFPVCTVRAVVGEATMRGAHRFAVDLAHCRHIVLSAARAAESIDGAMAGQLAWVETLPSAGRKKWEDKKGAYYKNSRLDHGVKPQVGWSEVSE